MFCSRYTVLALLIFGVASFSIDTPSNVTVLKEFSLKWTSQPNDPRNIVIVFYDATRTPQCQASQVSHREKLKVVQQVSDGQGTVDSILVQHSGQFILCAFSYGSDPPEDNIQESLFNSTVIFASLSPTTITITQTASTLHPTSMSQTRSNDATIIGSSLGGFFALVLAIVVILFGLCRCRLVRVQNSIITMETASRILETSSLPQSGQVRVADSMSGWRSQLSPSDVSSEVLPSYSSVHQNPRRKR